ncbi:MAG: sialidase family protein, partial [Acidimicrobiales bacterium]
RVNGDDSESRWHGMPQIAIDPNNPRHVVITARHQQPDGSTSCEAHTSYDAMATFSHAEVPVPASCARFNTVQRIDVAVGSNSKAYVAADGPEQAYVVPSSDGGLTFEAPVVADPVAGSRIRLAVRATPGAPDQLFVARQGSEQGSTPILNVGGAQIAAVSVSTDGGETFAPRVRANEASLGAEGPRIAVGPEGRVYVLYTTPPPANAALPPAQVRLARSLDNGKTWLRPDVVVEPSITPAPSGELNNYWPNLAVDQTSGGVYVTWSDERDGDADVWFRRSLNGGESFEGIQRLSHHPPKDGFFEYRSSLAVSPTGRLEAVYYEAQNTCPGQSIPCYTTNVFQRTSTDQGATFGPQIQLNERSFDYRLRRGAFQNGDIRDVDSAVAAADQVSYAVWLDTQLGSADNYNRDIFGVRAQLAPFVRIIPPPRFVVVPQAPPVLEAPPPPPPPPLPAPPTPIPPAAPIVPTQPPPLLSASAPVPVAAPLIAPAPGPEAEPQPGYQEATVRHHDARNAALLGLGVTGGVGVIALCLALAAGSASAPRPAVHTLGDGHRRRSSRRT